MVKFKSVSYIAQIQARAQEFLDWWGIFEIR